MIQRYACAPFIINESTICSIKNEINTRNLVPFVNLAAETYYNTISKSQSNNNIQNLPFDQSTIATSGYNSNENLQKAVEQQQQFVNNYNNYNPISTFNLPDKNSSNLENLRNLSQYNINNAFQQNKPIQLMPDTKNKHETLY